MEKRIISCVHVSASNSPQCARSTIGGMIGRTPSYQEPLVSEIDLPLPDTHPPAADAPAATVHPRLLLVLQAAIFMVSAEARVIAPLLPAIALGLQTAVAAAGMLITAYTIPYGLFQLVYGPLADRFSRQRVMGVALGLFSLGTFLSGFGPTISALYVLRFATGAAAAGVIPIALAYVGDAVPYRERQAALGGAPVYFYVLEWETPVDGGKWRSPHALEIGFVFDNVAKSESMSGIGSDQQRIADLMSEAWLAFARTGDPNNALLPQWPTYDAVKRASLVFDLELTVVEDWHGTERALFTTLPMGPMG